MKKALSIFLTILLSTSILSALAGCTSTNTQSSAQPAQGRYIEERIDQPGGEITQLSDGTYRMLTFSEKEEKWVAMESKDGSRTWTPIEYPWIDELKTKSLKKVQFVDNGDVYILANDVSYLFDGTELPSSEDLTQEEIDAMSLVQPGEDELFLHGTASELILMDYKLSSGMQSGEGYSSDDFGSDPNFPFFADTFLITDKNEILVFDGYGQIKQLRGETGELIRKYSEPRTSLNYSSNLITGNTLTMKGDNIIFTYNLDTGKEEESIELKGIQEGIDEVSGGSTTKHLLAEDADKNAYLYVSQTGVYRIAKDGSPIEKILDNELASFSGINYVIQGIYVNPDGSFLIQSENYGNGEERSDLFLYTYDPEASALPTDILSIYALRANDTIHEVVSRYKSHYPNSYVTYTIGLDQENIETEKDALEALMSNIEAGEGPDIVILDNLPVDTFIENDLLVDLKDTLQEKTKNGDLYTNVVQTYERQGTIYALPTQFQVPLLAGAGIENVNSLESLSTWLAQQDSPNIGETGSGFLREFHPVLSKNWFNKKGELDESQLKTDFQSLKTINEGMPKEFLKSEIESEKLSVVGFSGDEDAPNQERTPNANYFRWQQSDDAGAIFALAHIETYLGLLRVIEEKEGATAQFFPDKNSGSFIPKNTLGILKNSEQKEAAQNFLHTMLDLSQNETYKVRSYNDLGFTTNKTALKDYLQFRVDQYEEWGYPERPENDERWFQELWPGHEEMIAFVDSFENLEATHPMDAAKYHIFEKGLKSYLRNEASLDEAVTAIKSELENV